MTYAYVSGDATTTRKRQNPANIVWNQNTHLQLTPATSIHPLMMGATTGPVNGQTVKMAMALPLPSIVTTSAKTPLLEKIRNKLFDIDTNGKENTDPLLLKGEAAKTPPKKRKINKVAVLGARAHPI